MKLNEAGLDRIVRVVLGIVLLYLGLAGVVGGGLGIALDIVGLLALVTGLVGWCPAYAILGFKTRAS